MTDRRDWYRSYLRLCNEHRFDELGEYLAEQVEVNGEVRSAAEYGAGLAEFVERVPDFHWDLRHLLVDGAHLAAHLVDTGTTHTGAPVRIQEFAVYRLDGSRIAAVWGDLDLNRLPG